MASLGSDEKMRLDGLHKIATRGPCLERQPMAFKVSARAKWNAWQQLGNMSAEVAMEQYITLLSENVPGWMQNGHGDLADPQVHETKTADLNTLMQSQSEAAGLAMHHMLIFFGIPRKMHEDEEIEKRETGIPLQNLQFVPGMMPQSGTGEGTTWKTGLCDCFQDIQNALVTFFPWWTFGRIAETVDDGQTACSCNALIYLVICFVGMPCFLSCTYRRKLRNKFDLPESPPDCLIHVICEPCALCQEHRELELRGLDPSLGWVGCMERLKRSQE